MKKLKLCLMALLAMLYMTGCMVEEDDYYAKKTHPGYVVFEYSNDIIHQYIRRMDIINKFDIYYSQPTPAKRDSVDRLYFSEIKILNEANSDVWTINDLKYPGMYLKINTDGQSLSEQDAVWIVSESSNEINNSFPIKKEDGQYFIINHTGNIRDFLYFAEWKFYVNANRNEIELTGKCELLSVATPALKIDFEIIQPVLLGNYTLRNGIISGELKISAIDVDKDLKEETKAVYRQNNEVSITYMNNTELWSCIPYYYGYY